MSRRYWSSAAPSSSICARAAACFDWPTRPNSRGPTSPRPASKRYLVDAENSEHHGHDDERHHYPHAEDDHGLEESQRALEIGPDVGLERLGDLDQHVLEPARLLADSHHVDRQDRERRLLLHAGRDGA